MSERSINPKVKDAVSVILAELNTMSSSSKADIAHTIFDTVARDHRTLQQAFWSAIMKAQISYADSYTEFQPDLRNEAAVKLAKAVKATAIENNLDYGLPNI